MTNQVPDWWNGLDEDYFAWKDETLCLKHAYNDHACACADCYNRPIEPLKVTLSSSSINKNEYKER